MRSKDNFIIIGHSGFIGSAIYKNLRKEFGRAVEGISTSEIDFTKSTSSKKLLKLVNRNSIVIIAAAVTREKGDTLESMNLHLQIINNIATALEKQKIKKCIFLSTSDVYGIPKKLPITEETEVNPLTYYALAKLFAEKALTLVSKKSGFEILIIRFNGVYGPGQKNIGYGPNAFINSLVNSKKVELWGKGEELRDNLYVSDLARAIIALYKHNAKGTFNIATGQSVTFDSMVQVLKQITKISFEVIYKNRTSLPFDQAFDISKFTKIVPQFAFTPRRIAFRKTIAKYD